jgi:DNA-binding NarL/FixJ family response regulator
MGVQVYDFDERLSQNEIRELGDPRLELSIAGRNSSVADQFYTIDAEREPIQFDRGETLSAEYVARRLDLQSSKAVEKKVVIVESRIFLRECIQRSIQSALSIPVETLTSFSELDEQRTIESARLVIISLDETDSQESAKALSIIADLAPSLPTIVLSSKYNFEVMRAVIGCGAKGYIPMTMGFEIAVEAVRFVLAGGTYVPAECLLSAIPSAVTPSRPTASGAITRRELAVVRTIHQGKSNKIIAYELNMCESTVKVHVRHIMKKLRAKNRTDVAIKATALLACSRCTTQSECWSAGRCSMRLA